MTKKNKSKGLRHYLENKRVIMVISLLLAFFVWVVVAGFIDPGRNRPISGVPIDYTYNEAQYRESNLTIASPPVDRYADVRVTGDGAVLGPLSESSVMVYADYSLVTEAGTYDVPIRTRQIDPGSWHIQEYSTLTGGHSLDNPYHFVTLTFEEEVSKTLPVTVKADGISAAPSFFMDTPVATPESVTVRGPKSQVSQVSRVVAEVAAKEELDERKKYLGVSLILQDENGEALSEEKLAGISIAPDTVEVDVPILVLRTVDLKVDFSGLPPYFDTNWLYERVNLSVNKIQVVGPATSFNAYSNTLVVGTFDASQLGLAWESDPLTIQVPEGSDMRIKDEMRQVTVSLNTNGLTEKTFEVPINAAEVVNGPTSTQIRPLQDTVTVKLMGPQSQINALLPENITVEIEAFGITASKGGQQTLPARIRVPSADRCIPLGGYSIVCSVEPVS